jgi:hypothetical protein
MSATVLMGLNNWAWYVSYSFDGALVSATVLNNWTWHVSYSFDGALVCRLQF